MNISMQPMLHTYYMLIVCLLPIYCSCGAFLFSLLNNLKCITTYCTINLINAAPCLLICW